MKHSQNEIEISLPQLRPGMYVVRLDISWFKAFFIKGDRLIKDVEQIKQLKNAGVKRLVIDIDKGLAPENKKPIEPQEHTDPSPVAVPPVAEKKKAEDVTEAESSPDMQTPRQPASSAAVISRANDEAKPSSAPDTSPKSLEAERNAALKIRTQVLYLAHDIYTALEGDKKIESHQVNRMSQHAIASLKRNENALMNLVHIQQKSRKLTTHAFAVYSLALNLGLHLKLSEEQLLQLGLAALLHETGWIQLPANLMGKRTHYTETEKSLIKQHPTIGITLLAKSGLEKSVQTAILQHHELCDGSGYPNGLKKDNISVLARVLAICDCYDELVHQLRDMPGILPANAVKQLFKAAQKGLFDTDMMRVFVSMMGIYPVTSAVLLNTGEKAVVRELNEGALKTPVVAIWYDKRGFVLGDSLVVNLARQDRKQIHREIVEVIDPDNKKLDPANRLRSDLE